MPRRISQGRELIVELTEAPPDAQLFTQSRTLRTTQLLGLNSATGWFDIAAPPHIVARADFHRLSRAGGPRLQLRKSSSAASHSIALRAPSWPSAWPSWKRIASLRSALAVPSPEGRATERRQYWFTMRDILPVALSLDDTTALCKCS